MLESLLLSLYKDELKCVCVSFLFGCVRMVNLMGCSSNTVYKELRNFYHFDQSTPSNLLELLVFQVLV